MGETMKTFWVLTYLDVNDKLDTERFDNEDAAEHAFKFVADRPLFLDKVTRVQSIPDHAWDTI